MGSAGRWGSARGNRDSDADMNSREGEGVQQWEWGREPGGGWAAGKVKGRR